jgi:hypothetical protein
MAVFSCFAGAVDTDAGSTNDVQDIIDAFATKATGLSNPWTDGGSGLYTSPTDAAGRFFSVTLTAISATNLEMVVKDDTATTICTRRIQIVSGPQNWWLAVSENYCWIEIDNATVEALGAGLLDLSPESQTAHGAYVWGRGNRNASDSVDGLGTTQEYFYMIDNGSPAPLRRAVAQDRDSANTAISLVTGAGTSLWLPYLMCANFGGTLKVAGRLMGFYYGEATGTSVVLPIGDAAETGTFRNSNLSQGTTARAMIRVG